MTGSLDPARGPNSATATVDRTGRVDRETGPRKRSAPVLATSGQGHRPDPQPGEKKPFCVFCGSELVKRQRHCRYCSAKCRAKASVERRIAAAVEAEVQRQQHSSEIAASVEPASNGADRDHSFAGSRS
jgi:hypothetical protein